MQLGKLGVYLAYFLHNSMAPLPLLLPVGDDLV